MKMKTTKLAKCALASAFVIGIGCLNASADDNKTSCSSALVHETAECTTTAVAVSACAIEPNPVTCAAAVASVPACVEAAKDTSKACGSTDANPKK